MFEECLEVFKRELDYDNNLILDEYIPADGSYIIVDAEGKIKNYQDIECITTEMYLMILTDVLVIILKS